VARSEATEGSSPPVPLDVRGADGVPKGLVGRHPARSQLEAIARLEERIGSPVSVRYNALTATPNHLLSYDTYLSPPSAAPAERIARTFLSQWRDVFRFDDRDLRALRLKSRAFIPDMGTTVLLFEQQAGGLPVYHGEVGVNVNKTGRVISVGSDSFPRLRVSGGNELDAREAIRVAVTSIGAPIPEPRYLGRTDVLTTYGDVPPTYVAAPTYSLGKAFIRPVTVRRTIFPLGDVGRRAYDLTVTYDGMRWRSIVDASDGRVLRRERLTLSLGPEGRGIGVGRLAAMRPDIQDLVERVNPNGTAVGKVFDGMPTTLSGPQGYGRPKPGRAPKYGAESATTPDQGRGFRYSLVYARNSAPLQYTAPYGQVLRGFPDAANPTPESPFGWFYLPTASGAKEIHERRPTFGTSRDYGYTMDPEAAARNAKENSPRGKRLQPFSVTRTPLARPVVTEDGRRLRAVFESNYGEGNNISVADDRNADNEASMGIRAYAAGRKFTAKRFDFRNTYEFGGKDAGGTSSDPFGLTPPTDFFPPTTDPDLLPGVMALFQYGNLMHDYLYDIGFTEGTWNFQQDNFGIAGAGNDGLYVHAQSGQGTDNATFEPTPEGENPHMNVYLNTDALRRSDNAFELDTFSHEFFHGVSNRSLGKGDIGCAGFGLLGEPGGQGEGWGDYIAGSMSDDDSMFEFDGGEFETSFRRLPLGNYRWSYGALNGIAMMRRDNPLPDENVPFIPFEAHDIGEMWAATLWDMRELMIARQPSGLLFDGNRRLGSGASYYIGGRKFRSTDDAHPIDYRRRFNDDEKASVGADHIKRPGVLAREIAKRGDRKGPLANAVRGGGRGADVLVLRGMQLSPCNPSFVQSRDSILLADRELTGGENASLIWRAFASHGVGRSADSTSRLSEITGFTPIVLEDFAVPETVAQCERTGAPGPPRFSLVRERDGVRVKVAPAKRATRYTIVRSDDKDGTFGYVGVISGKGGGSLLDTGAEFGRRYYYRVRASLNADCVSRTATKSIT
jgi:hypothetical protein